MKIGLLAFHGACNFGAFLQLLSTIEYIKKHGDEPIIVNWIPKDTRKVNEKRSLPEVRELYAGLRKQYFPLTDLCATDKNVADIIEKEDIEAVIIGSDAVSQHHPLRGRIHFPCRRIVYIDYPTSDRMYPNCFWGSFSRHLKTSIPIAVISGSSQDSKFYFIKGKTKLRMKESILSFRYISVRDEWTKDMIEYLTDEEIVPEVTPDPVFAFNFNASHLLPSKEEIVHKFDIPDNYVILSFKDFKSVDQAWIDRFQELANTDGLSCVKLPYSDARAIGNVLYSVGDCISPLDWYALIKYSKGYVGNNMHPIVTSIANGVPFFSFDNYGISQIDGKWTNGESSKIYHIIKQAGLLENRVFTRRNDYFVLEPDTIYYRLKHFDVEKERLFADSYLMKYQSMMEDVYKSIKTY